MFKQKVKSIGFNISLEQSQFLISLLKILYQQLEWLSYSSISTLDIWNYLRNHILRDTLAREQ